MRPSPIEARPAARAGHLLGAFLVAAGLAGCTFPAPPPPDTSAGRQDDAVCRSLAAAPGVTGRPLTPSEERALARSDVVLAAEAGAGPVGTSSTPPASGASTPKAIRARCATSGHS